MWAITIILILCACVNPFAPKLADVPSEGNIISDQKTIEGIFQNFRYAYIFKDTVVYGNLLTNDFTFVYRNYDQGVDVSWGRDEDMLTTSGLFQASQNLDLLWNEVIVEAGDSLVKDISRGFTLNIVFSPTDILSVQGRANLHLRKELPANIWKIAKWRDESNY